MCRVFSVLCALIPRVLGSQTSLPSRAKERRFPVQPKPDSAKKNKKVVHEKTLTKQMTLVLLAAF